MCKTRVDLRLCACVVLICLRTSSALSLWPKRDVVTSTHSPSIPPSDPVYGRRTAYEEAAHVQRRLQPHATNWARNQRVHEDHLQTPDKLSQVGRATTPMQPRQASAQTIAAVTLLADYYDDYLDIQYLTTVSVGSPPERFAVLFDTGSADFWLGAPGSSSLPSTYDPSQSETFQDLDIPIKVFYEDGSTFNGTAGTDVVSFADFTVDNAVLETGVVSGSWGNGFISGVIGLAWSSVSSSGKPTFLENLVASGQLERNIFSFSLIRGVDALSETAATEAGITSGGSLIVGGIDAAELLGDVQFFPIVERAHWTVCADGMTVDGKLVHGTENIEAMMDSGTTIIVMPDDVFAATLSGLRAEVDQTLGHPAVDCTETIPELALRIGGSDFSVAPVDLILSAIPINTRQLAVQSGVKMGSIACYLALAGGQWITEANSSQPMTIFGNTFLKSWVSVYDYDNATVGLGLSVHRPNFTSPSEIVDLKLQQSGYNRTDAVPLQSNAVTSVSTSCIAIMVMATISVAWAIG